MSFVSFEFIVFSTLVFPLYFLLRHRHRSVLLLLSSLFFYTYGNGTYVIVPLLSTLFDYWIALRLEGTSEQRKRKLYLVSSLFLNFGLLFFFKYFDFFNESLGEVVRGLGLNYDPPNVNLVLPIGISFYTFQEVAYVIDVYRRRLPAERSLGVFTTFVVFLVATPSLGSVKSEV